MASFPNFVISIQMRKNVVISVFNELSLFNLKMYILARDGRILQCSLFCKIMAVINIRLVSFNVLMERKGEHHMLISDHLCNNVCIDVH